MVSYINAENEQNVDYRSCANISKNFPKSAALANFRPNFQHNVAEFSMFTSIADFSNRLFPQKVDLAAVQKCANLEIWF